MLVIACPHALGLAIPLVIALSTACRREAGILVKDRLALERMRTVDAVLFDKTGTLTKGAHKVTGVAARRPTSRVLPLAAAVEADSEHPLARAIVRAAGERGAARGHRLPVADRPRGAGHDRRPPTYAVGGPALLRELDVDVPDELATAAEWAKRGAAVLYLVRFATDNRCSARSRWRTRSGRRPAQAIAELRGPASGRSR